MDTRFGETQQETDNGFWVWVCAANYEYGFYWYFGQDGAIQHEVKLTGEVSTTLASPEDAEDPRFGTLVLPNVLAAHHQHLFCARLDMAVDDEDGGRGLVVSEARPFSLACQGLLRLN